MHHRQSVIISLVVLSCAFLSPVFSVTGSANPFLSPSEGTQSAGNASTANASPRSGFSLALATTQSTLREKISTLVLRVKEGTRHDGLCAYATILLLSLAYGAIHALGPGHRKTVVFAYFLQADAHLSTGITAGIAMAAAHAGSAVAIVLGGYALLSQSLTLFVNDATIVLTRLTFVAIGVLGLYLLIQHFREGHHTTNNQSTPSRVMNKRDLFILSLSAGLVPCPGVAMVMLFAVSLRVVALGIAAAVAMSMGMAITLTAIAILSKGVRDGVLTIGNKTNERWSTRLHDLLEITSALTMVIFAVVMSLAL